MKGNRPNTEATRNIERSRRGNFFSWLGLLLALIFLTWCVPVFAQDARKVKTSIQPEYPELARKNNIQGVARLQILIAPDGSVKEIKVLGGSPVLTQAAVDAVKKWKYEAASAESIAVVRFEFKP